VAAAERLHLQSCLHSSVWNVIAPAFHEFEILQDSLYRVASEWLQKECRIRRISYVGIKVFGKFAPSLALLAFALLNRGFRIYDSESEPKIVVH
jgi:hypothetical protein